MASLLWPTSARTQVGIERATGWQKMVEIHTSSEVVAPADA